MDKCLPTAGRPIHVPDIDVWQRVVKGLDSVSQSNEKDVTLGLSGMFASMSAQGMLPPDVASRLIEKLKANESVG